MNPIETLLGMLSLLCCAMFGNTNSFPPIQLAFSNYAGSSLLRVVTFDRHVCLSSSHVIRRAIVVIPNSPFSFASIPQQCSLLHLISQRYKYPFSALEKIIFYFVLVDIWDQTKQKLEPRESMKRDGTNLGRRERRDMQHVPLVIQNL